MQLKCVVCSQRFLTRTIGAIVFTAMCIMLVLCVQELRRDANRQRQAGKLYAIYLDFLNMAESMGIKNGCFPATISNDTFSNRKFFSSPYENAVVSWRFFAGSSWMRGGTEAYNYFHGDEPWNSPINLKAWSYEFCWGGNPCSKRYNQRDYWTNVMGIVGPDTAFDVQEAEKLENCENLIFLVSVKDSGIHWGQPGDIDVRNLPPKFREGIDGDGIYAVFWDGAIWFIRKDVPLELLTKFFTITEVKKNNRYDELIKYAIELRPPSRLYKE